MKIDETYFPGFTQKWIETEPGIVINTLIGGSGKEAVLLLHGHPETHLMWRFLTPELTNHYTVVITDLRGYGDSSKPEGLPDHSNYSKRAMADDQVKVMQALGFDRFHVAGHDRGARVLHRMIIDHPEKIRS
ncbi:MAG: alpha/beta fold hydrolase, partial [Acidaminococcaceae bacterium]|nr:alpha/beta fold hydrolase [Acidaminococcaceae bacterium]